MQESSSSSKYLPVVGGFLTCSRHLWPKDLGGFAMGVEVPEAGEGCCHMCSHDLERPLVSSLPREPVGREGLKPTRRGALCPAACLMQPSCIPPKFVAQVPLLVTLLA